MRLTRVFCLVLPLALLLSACVPNLFGTGSAGSARVSYGVASGDTGGFELAVFSTRNVSAVWRGGRLELTLREGGGGDRILFLSISQASVEARSCPLTTGSSFGAAPGVACSLYYRQAASAGAAPLQGMVREGSLELTEFTGSSLSFRLEATLETPRGGSFALRASGASEVQRAQ